MKRIIDAIENVGRVDSPEGELEVCAAATATYDEGKNRLTVALDCFLRTTDIRTKEKRFPADWLPKAETITESVGPDDTYELSREIFHRWVRKVREAAPSLQQANF